MIEIILFTLHVRHGLQILRNFIWMNFFLCTTTDNTTQNIFFTKLNFSYLRTPIDI